MWNGEIVCSGSYSCYEAISIENLVDSDSYHIKCYGLYSCANVNYTYSAGGDVMCYGELSCLDSTIIVEYNENDHSEDTANNVLCYSDRACKNAIIYGQVNLGGHLSGENSTIYNTYNDTTYYFLGPNSGDGATVICKDNDTCNIHCDDNACNNLTLKCSNGDDSYVSKWNVKKN